MASETQFTKSLPQYDVFISHASEDKEDFVRPLANLLKALGVTVWYDEFSIEFGASISSSIDKGVAYSKAGLVVLSDSFLEKVWTDYEFRGFLMRQMGDGTPILPIWHNLSLDRLKEYSPTLMDKKAIESKQGIKYIAAEVIRIVRPDIRKGLELHLKFVQSIASAETELRPLSDLKPSPPRRDKLSDGMMRRIRRVCLSLRHVSGMTVEQSYDSFLRDLHPEEELQYWEWLSLVIEIYQTETKCEFAELEALFRFLLVADFKKMIDTISAQDLAQIEQSSEIEIDVSLVVKILKETNQHPIASQ